MRCLVGKRTIDREGRMKVVLRALKYPPLVALFPIVVVSLSLQSTKEENHETSFVVRVKTEILRFRTNIIS